MNNKTKTKVIGPYCIRTSDRVTFKRCRRRWNWSSGLRHNLEKNEAAAPLWTGSGVHYALEDFHGYNYYGNPGRAFKAYTLATKADPDTPLPYEWKDQAYLAIGMMNYYTQSWLKNRTPLQIYVVNNVPQVEVTFKIRLPIKSVDGRDIYYQGTFDGVAIDEHGRLWIVEYKTAKAFSVSHFQTDQQISSYCWAGAQIYPGMHVEGVMYMQFKKSLPDYPKILATGKLSTDKKQATTHQLYKESILRLYGKDYANVAPTATINFLNTLLLNETEEADNFIRTDLVYRNNSSIAAENEKILMEAVDITNPNLSLYPNPTRNCSFDCNFFSACVSMDDGSDWEYELKLGTKKRADTHTEGGWRDYLPAFEDPILNEPILGVNEEELHYG